MPWQGRHELAKTVAPGQIDFGVFSGIFLPTSCARGLLALHTDESAPQNANTISVQANHLHSDCSWFMLRPRVFATRALA